MNRALVLMGLSGFKRSGKDTAAKALVAKGFQRIGFADAVYAEVHARWPASISIADADKDQPQATLDGLSKRQLLIQVGMAARETDPLHWVKIAMSAAKRSLSQGHSVVLSDLRLVNEIDAVRALGGYIVWINRPGLKAGTHVTEHDRSLMADVIVDNDGTPEALGMRIVQYAKAFRAIGPKWAPLAA